VDQRVGGVLELLGHHRARGGLDDLLGAGDGAAHALLGRGQLQLGAEQQQHLAALDRHALGHDQDQLVALGGGHEGQGDAGVAEVGSTITPPGFNRPLASSRLDHRHADAVLDRSDRVEELQLGHDRALGLQFGGQAGRRTSGVSPIVSMIES
jgi:hypothetical protein